MSTPTPDQLRALADTHWLPIAHEEEVAAALRSAADQLEAVRAYVEGNWSHGQLTTNGAYLPLVDVGPLLNMLTNGEQR